MVDLAHKIFEIMPLRLRKMAGLEIFGSLENANHCFLKIGTIYEAMIAVIELVVRIINEAILREAIFVFRVWEICN